MGEGRKKARGETKGGFLSSKRGEPREKTLHARVNGDDAIFMVMLRCVHGLSCFKMVVKAACADTSRCALIGAEHTLCIHHCA